MQLIMTMNQIELNDYYIFKYLLIILNYELVFIIRDVGTLQCSFVFIVNDNLLGIANKSLHE